MSFLYPVYFWGLFVLFIPIIIHLFNFRKAQIIYFSNIRFLQQVKEASSNKLKIKHLLILFSRLLFLLFIILAFAQPFIPVKNSLPKKGESIVSIYLDNSHSMSAENQNGSLLNQAIRKCDEIINSFSPGTRFQLLTNHFSPQSQFAKSKEDIQNELKEISFSSVYRSLDEVYQRQKGAIDRNITGNIYLFWVSDFQKSSSPDLNKYILDSNYITVCVPLQTNEIKNIYVDTLYFHNPVIQPLVPSVLKAKLTNYSKNRIENQPVRLLVDDKQIASGLLTLEPFSTAETEFNFTVYDDKWKKGTVTFDDYPVIFDNKFYFSFKPSRTIYILGIRSGEVNSYLNHVFISEKFFNYTEFSEKAIDYNSIPQNNFIILNGVDTLNNTLTEILVQFVQKGGTLAIFPDKNYSGNSELYHKGLFEKLELPVIRLVKNENQENDDSNAGNETENDLINEVKDNRVNFTLLDYNSLKTNHFFEDVFEKIPDNMDLPDVVQRLYWQKTTRLISTPIINFKNGDPFMSQFSVAKGKVFLFASEIAGNESNFAKHALFVPIMYKMALKSAPEIPLSYNFQNNLITLDIKSSSKEPVFKLKQKGSEYIPAQRSIEGKLFLEISRENMEPGYYQLNDEDSSIISINNDKLESQLTFYSTNELEKLKTKNNKLFLLTDNFQKISTFISELETGKPLWIYMLMLALFFLLMEGLLIRLLK